VAGGVGVAGVVWMLIGRWVVLVDVGAGVSPVGLSSTVVLGVGETVALGVGVDGWVGLAAWGGVVLRGWRVVGEVGVVLGVLSGCLSGGLWLSWYSDRSVGAA
jgi:hypothetical protein